MNIEYSFTFDSDLNMMSGYGKITAYLDDKFEDEIEVGHLSFHYYNGYEMGDDQDLLFSADAISGDQEYMISNFIDTDFDGGKIITLDRITILNEYNQDEAEPQILKKFIEFCHYMNFDYVLVIAADPRNDGDKEIIKFPKLKQYQELGFTKLSGSDSRAPVMIKILDEDEIL
ncbi:hypothetical protein E1I69_13125 [Bacillus timonensis]|uniref:Uncharacterized protein n=1 Tax=Bacillus timonensis TaxID=1033734 RepID=A0A4S3PQZ4_9BACI|nr:hypothetical protein [Bacillus timonensis]THE11948.1 hypothetical protein E1I69_13125 [Bacillus timonensis]